MKQGVPDIRDAKLQEPDTLYVRRDVIRAAVAMPALLAAQSPNDTIRVAIIGVGNRGSYLLRTLLKIPGIRVIPVCDLGAERLANAASVVSAPRTPPATYTDFRKMLR